MGSILINDPNQCATSAGITSIVLSSTGPWGLNTITGVLTIPNSASILRGQPRWIWDATGTVNEMVFYEMDNTTNEYPAFVSPTSSYQDRIASFENNGVGLEFIYSSENGGVLPANPNQIVNLQGFADRKYQQYEYFIWVDTSVGRPTHWWSPVSNTWWQIRPLRNVLTVGPNKSFDFQTLNAAFSYINGLPASPVADDPNQDARQSDTNRWTVVLWGATEITATLEMLDFVNVMFMPGAQIIDSATSHPGGRMLSLAATDPVRVTTLGTGGYKFRAVWAAVNPYFGNSSNASLYNIVHEPNAGTVDGAAIFISNMWSASISNLSIFAKSGSVTPTSYSGIRVEGNLLGTETPPMLRQGVHLSRINVCCEPSFSAATRSSGFWLNHDAGTCYISDCQSVFTMDSFPVDGASSAIHFNGSGSSNVEIDECRIQTCVYQTGSSRNQIGVMIPSTATTTGTLVIARSDIEAYGTSSDGGRAYGVDFAAANAHIILSRVSIIQTSTSTSALASACVRYSAPTAISAIIDLSVLSAPDVNADGISTFTLANASSSEFSVDQNVIQGGRYSIGLNGQTLTNANFYGNHIEGVINGTFAANAATATYNTTYQV